MAMVVHLGSVLAGTLGPAMQLGSVLLASTLGPAGGVGGWQTMIVGSDATFAF